MSLNLVKMAREAGFHVGDQFAAGCSEDDLRKLAIIITRELNENQPPKRRWLGLTDQERSDIYNQTDWNLNYGWDYEQAIEAKLKEKNT